jgi:hypothetical protein
VRVRGREREAGDGAVKRPPSRARAAPNRSDRDGLLWRVLPSPPPPLPPHPVSHSDGVLRREREGGGGGGLEPDRVHVAHAWGNHNGEG